MVRAPIALGGKAVQPSCPTWPAAPTTVVHLLCNLCMLPQPACRPPRPSCLHPADHSVRSASPRPA
jgi:hypothetical protein